jgi:PhoPQ-activated pathogenicity-related protein
VLKNDTITITSVTKYIHVSEDNDILLPENMQLYVDVLGSNKMMVSVFPGSDQAKLQAVAYTLKNKLSPTCMQHQKIKLTSM